MPHNAQQPTAIEQIRMILADENAKQRQEQQRAAQERAQAAIAAMDMAARAEDIVTRPGATDRITFPEQQPNDLGVSEGRGGSVTPPGFLQLIPELLPVNPLQLLRDRLLFGANDVINNAMTIATGIGNAIPEPIRGPLQQGLQATGKALQVVGAVIPNILQASNVEDLLTNFDPDLEFVQLYENSGMPPAAARILGTLANFFGPDVTDALGPFGAAVILPFLYRAQRFDKRGKDAVEDIIREIRSTREANIRGIGSPELSKNQVNQLLMRFLRDERTPYTVQVPTIQTGRGIARVQNARGAAGVINPRAGMLEVIDNETQSSFLINPFTPIVFPTPNLIRQAPDVSFSTAFGTPGIDNVTLLSDLLGDVGKANTGFLVPNVSELINRGTDQDLLPTELASILNNLGGFEAFDQNLVSSVMPKAVFGQGVSLTRLPLPIDEASRTAAAASRIDQDLVDFASGARNARLGTILETAPGLTQDQLTRLGAAITGKTRVGMVTPQDIAAAQNFDNAMVSVLQTQNTGLPLASLVNRAKEFTVNDDAAAKAVQQWLISRGIR